MAFNNQDLEPHEPGPLLEFRPHNGRVNCAQPRVAIPGPRTGDRAGVVCCTSLFPFQNPADKIIVDSLVAGFQLIQKNILERGEPKQKPSRKTTCGPSYYKRLRGQNGNVKHLSYAYWFYLAACWGPDHPHLRGIRKEMSNLWDVTFPTHAITYPGNMSTEKQKRLFGGFPTALYDEPKVQKGAAEKPHDTAMQVRVRELKQTIENTPIEGLAGAIGDLPIMLNKDSPVDDTSEVEELKRQLSVTRRDLKETLGQVEGLEQELTNLRMSTDMTIHQMQRDADVTKADLKVVDIRSSKVGTAEVLLSGRVDAWEEKLANMDKRVEKAMETCALVLGILSAPGGDKRKRGDEA
ncbi:hypothetical protein FSARC_5747 [Fusarium sarcochroum]|uniref:Uncharacterized protein n=1 Tax=Fusarium sarcochroum TaxID=1208366 RepID=A0A8H4TYR0_9HYPO|nr:hypothetical protein FSARC_5747 [Fusarium sarcochroum]